MLFEFSSYKHARYSLKKPTVSVCCRRLCLISAEFICVIDFVEREVIALQETKKLRSVDFGPLQQKNYYALSSKIDRLTLKKFSPARKFAPGA